MDLFINQMSDSSSFFMKIPYRIIVLLGLLLVMSLPFNGVLAEPIVVTDVTGRVVSLNKPARRIVSLAPSVTELLFAVGAGAWVVGVADYSNYPLKAQKIPRVGGYDRFDLEAVLALSPDLVVSWSSGNPPALLTKLTQLGLTLFMTNPHHLDDIPLDLERLGLLTGTQALAKQEAERFRARRLWLSQQVPEGVPPVRTFYQVWYQPLMTINGEHVISDVIALCGGENVFAGLPQLAPVIDVEAVLATDPEVIIASGMGEQRPEWLDHWRSWKPLKAVELDNLFFIPPDLIQRHTPRILDGAEALCQQLSLARQRRLKTIKNGSKPPP